MKDCTTCKYGYEDERLGIPMCHHPKRFSEDCVDFNMHEEKEIETEQSGSSETSNYLNELADYARRQVEELLPVIKKYNDYSEEQIEELRTHLMAMFLEGAGWQKKQMLKEYVRKDAILEWAEKKKNDVKKFGQRYNEANYYNSGCHDTIQELIDKINEL